MGRLGEELMTIAVAIIGVAILAVIVSKNANTVNVVGSVSKAFNSGLATALSPVTGSGASVGIAYN